MSNTVELSGTGRAKPWLSILIPAYNAAPYIEECLGSICAQRLGAIEVIVVDDCSTDGTHEVAARFSTRSDNVAVIVLHNDRNLGVSASRNLLLEMAKGDYIWFVDADDRLRPDSVRKLREIVSRHAPDVVIFDYAAYPDNDVDFAEPTYKRAFIDPSRILVEGRDRLLMDLLTVGEIQPWTKVARRGVWGDAVRFPSGRCFEDVVTIPLMALEAKTYYYEPTPWIDYRRTPGSITSRVDGAKCMDMMLALEEITQKMRQRETGLSDAVLQQLNVFCVRNFIYVMREYRKNPDDPDKREICAACLSKINRIVRGQHFFNRDAETRRLWFRFKKWQLRTRFANFTMHPRRRRIHELATDSGRNVG